SRIATLRKFKELLKPEILKASIHKKLSAYLLNDKSSRKDAREKANWFFKALGFSSINMAQLENQILLDFNKIIFRRRQNEYGDSFSQICPIIGVNGRTIDVQFVWQIDSEGYLRLI